MNELLAGYPVVIQIPVAWGEMDAYGHVNNAVYFRYFESARIAYFRQLGLKQFMDQSGVGPILASIQCRFKFPVTFPDTLSVAARVTEVGADRFTMHHRIVSQRHSRIVAEGDGVIVAYDYQLGQKASVPEDVRAAIMRIEETAG